VSLQIQINGETRELSRDQIFLSELISDLALAPQRIAVEVNQKLARRAEWDTLLIADGDRIEIVHFVGGGCAHP
jgi:thiamine biosynthesis protein ThiS